MAGLEVDADCVEEGAVCAGEGDVVGGEHQGAPWLWCLRMSQRKKGAPRRAVAMPTGSSAGAMRVLQRRSAPMRRVAPRRAEPGRSLV